MATSKAIFQCLLLLIASAASRVLALEASTPQEAIDNEGQWISLKDGIEFQPNAEALNNPSLRQAQNRFLSTTTKSPYLPQDGYYHAYSQAWRMLGFYVDCDESVQQNNNEEQNRGHRNRELAGGGGQRRATCQRYLLWAAYVDLNYEGGGIGEYQFWDAEDDAWDTTTCETHGDGRCAKMDCHEVDSTTWTLLGVYKEAAYASEWFEQLFKHAGYCLWSNDVYEFMHGRYDSWPEGCQDTGVADEKGNDLYLDLKPSAGANLTLALYTDNICKTEYTGNKVSVEDAAGDKFVTGENLQLFNDYMEVYKVRTEGR
jgi:hypothetical protein